MSCKALATLDICARHKDHLNSFLFTYDENINDAQFFIDLRDPYKVVKSYALGDGLSFYSSNQLLWEFGDILDVPVGTYSYAVKSVRDGRPSTEFGGSFKVEKQLTEWRL